VGRRRKNNRGICDAPSMEGRRASEDVVIVPLEKEQPIHARVPAARAAHDSARHSSRGLRGALISLLLPRVRALSAGAKGDSACRAGKGRKVKSPPALPVLPRRRAHAGAPLRSPSSRRGQHAPRRIARKNFTRIKANANHRSCVRLSAERGSSSSAAPLKRFARSTCLSGSLATRTGAGEHSTPHSADDARLRRRE